MTQTNHAPGAASGGAHGAIDVHAHLAPRPLLEDLAEGRVRFGHIEVARHEATYKLAFSGGPQTRPVNVGLTDLDKRRKWRGENGLALQVAGGWLDMFGYDLPADEGADWSRLLTDSMIKVTADDPNQAVLGTVPLQAPEAAAQALREQRAAGLPGVMIGTQAAGRDLADPEFTPFWEAADETDAVVSIHPGFGGASPRYQDFGLVNGLARLEDTTVTLARMLYAGIPAKHPRARIVVAHAGAALPYVLGRLVRNHVLHPDTTYDPLESFAKLYFDSVVFDPDALRFLLGKVGASRVLLGSDYPFPIGDLTPRDILADAGLSDDDRGLVEAGNAWRLFLGEGAS